jgi:cytoskeletal protein CcmA (bactofilin family)
MMQNSDEEGKKLIVGRDIALNGEIKSCDKLVVEGHVEANISDCRVIEIAEGGSFKGMAEIDTAEISGVFDGSITARELLVVRATGRITGKVRFGQLEIERGGEITGDVQAYGPDKARNAPTPIVADVPAE